jgi:hypothetical protein
MTKEEIQAQFFKVVEERDHLWDLLFFAQKHIDRNVYSGLYQQIEDALNDVDHHLPM